MLGVWLAALSVNKCVIEKLAMTTTAFSVLAFLAVIALYLKWNYASPYVGGAELEGYRFLKRSIPLILFLASGLIGAISLRVSSDMLFYMLFGISACCLVAAPIVTYLHRRR